ncbi:MAG: hypothetical protein FWG61_00870 [Firmicutes bacterium]|nr:hypothetical protein [Bacillota bacterium]
MEFVSLRSLQRGLPEVWQSLKKEKGRLVLTNKGQPAYLLVDLANKNLVSLINWLDYYQANPDLQKNSYAGYVEHKAAAQKFLAAMEAIHEDGLSEDDEAALTALENGKYRVNISRELDI